MFEKWRKRQIEKEENRAISWFCQTELLPLCQRYPTRCEYVYDAIRKWAQGDLNRILVAAAFLFSYELASMRRSADLEITTIFDEIQEKKIEA